MDSWQRRIDRAAALAKANTGAAALLTQYGQVLTVQRAVYDALVAGARLTGSLERDLAALRPLATRALAAVRAIAPAPATANAPGDAAALDGLLREGWRTASMPFLARLVLQPYAEALAHLAASREPACRPLDRNLAVAPGRDACPFCGGPPQLAVLRSDSAADAGGRALVCATCATNWPRRRILCAYCAEEDERKLGYFVAAEFDHLRVDTCDTCEHYLKTVDLTRLGIAVPLVDEVASGALDVWAVERGYEKVEVNLLGL
jgi:FdhE protein